MVRVLRKQYDFRPFQSHVPALPVHVDSHKGRACPPDWESISASQEIRVVRREFPRSLSSRGKSSDFSRQAHAFMREPWAGSKGSSKGTGNREQGTGMAAAAWIMKSYMLQGRRPFLMNAVVASMSPLQGFQGFRVSFYRGNVSFVLVVSLRARLFLFPFPCSLFPLIYPWRFR